jgi:hypothetical protein
MEQIHI